MQMDLHRYHHLQNLYEGVPLSEKFPIFYLPNRVYFVWKITVPAVPVVIFSDQQWLALNNQQMFRSIYFNAVET